MRAPGQGAPAGGPAPGQAESFTIAEAAELTGLTKKALRHRVERGQLRAIRRDGLRWIARTELERAGIAIVPSDPELALVPDLRAALGERELDLRHARRDLDHAGRELEGLRRQLGDAARDGQGLRRELGDARAETEVARREADRARTEAESVRSEARDVQLAVEHARSQLRRATSELEDARRRTRLEQAWREDADTMADAAVAEAESAREWRRRFLDAGPIERRRLLRELDDVQRAAQVFFSDRGTADDAHSQ